jgi:hypothetical protein
MEATELTDCRVQVENPQNRAIARGLAQAKVISNTMQKTACLYLIYITRYVSFNLDATSGSGWFHVSYTLHV